MSTATRDAELRREQDAFDAQLPDLLLTHGGKVVLFAQGAPVAFFSNVADAYSAGLERFGIDGVFVIDVIKPKNLAPASISWDAGVLFG